MDAILEKVRAFASDAHGQQRRKFADEPYINHPIRVMQICREYNNDITLLSAALLHDVLEDTDTGSNMIREFLQTTFNEDQVGRILKFVEELTDIYTKKRYPALNRRQRKGKEAMRLKMVSPEAQTIKYADIIDNSLDIKNAEPDFSSLFLYECRSLLRVMDRGDHNLRKRASQTVQHCIAEQKTE